MAYILMALMMRNTLAILMFFHQNIPSISLLFLMVMDLMDLVTRDGTPCVRPIFDIFFYSIHVLSLVIEVYD